MVDGVGRTQVPGAAGLGLIGGQHMDAAVVPVQIPGLAVAQIAVEDQRLILGEHAHGVDAGVDTVGKGEVDDAVFTAEGHRGLCVLFGQVQQTAALAACQKHGDTLFFSHKLSSSVSFQLGIRNPNSYFILSQGVCQMSSQYSRIVRSELKVPAMAMF